VITGTTGVVVGRVAELRPHPNGDFIWLADLDIGTGEAPQIVWGGVPVVREGDLVPVARPGAWLPATANKRGPYKIRRRHYRGQLSEGMLCSLAELGWDPAVTDRVALLSGDVVKPGDSLDDVGKSWPLILRPADAFCAEKALVTLESPMRVVSLI
jgi:phenylalanyl-tRNA synthetase beta chain